jgi:tRNA modification GTPase
MLSHDDECIIAQCTPQGKGALALLRLSGASVRTRIQELIVLASGKKITQVPTHTIHYASLVDRQGILIDQVMVIVMDGPRTFTGQDVIEITCHNNPFIVESIIHEVVHKGARLAQEGEFSRRAFFAGKIDLVQAEAIHELIAAQTQQALKASLAQLEGSFSHWISRLEKELLQIVAWCEASFEFLDEEVEFKDRIKQQLEALLTRIETIKRLFNAQQQIRQGIRIALLGSVNTGKSSLFNILLERKRAIVSNIAGTTRDSIEAGLMVQGQQWTLVDTAGLRITEDLIEQEGIKRSYEEAKKADIILLIVDGSRPLGEQELEVYDALQRTYSNKTILVHAKSDLPRDSRNTLVDSCALKISYLDTQDRAYLEELIHKKADALCAHLDAPFLLNQRQYNLLISLEAKLLPIGTMLANPQYEFISYHLQDALTTLSELTGKAISEAALDTVFKEFCVGK